jgi:hypothetical protein
MSERLKFDDLEVESLVGMLEELRASVGCGEDDSQREAWVRSLDGMLRRNGYTRAKGGTWVKKSKSS